VLGAGPPPPRTRARVSSEVILSLNASTGLGVAFVMGAGVGVRKVGCVDVDVSSDDDWGGDDGVAGGGMEVDCARAAALALWNIRSLRAENKLLC
jgi:hypothetical protein